MPETAPLYSGKEIANAHCPRCGYGLRGALETWKRECPINGVCTECGLEFEWGELLCERRNVPRWCVEYAMRWGLVKASVKTLLVMMWPRKFWRELKMVHEPGWGRFSGLALLALFLLYLVFTLSVGFQTYKQFRNLKLNSIATPYDPVMYGLYATLNPFSTYQYTYSTAAPPSTWTRQTYSPRTIAKRLSLTQLLSEVRAKTRGNQFIPFWGSWHMSIVIAQGFMLAMLCSLAFVALPQSLKKARVRWKHLIRIAMYSLLINVPPLAFYMHNQLDSIFNYWVLPDWLIPGSQVYVLTAMILWWSLAAKHYLKLPHAWGVGGSMVVLAYAGGLFIVSVIDFVMI